LRTHRAFCPDHDTTAPAAARDHYHLTNIAFFFFFLFFVVALLVHAFASSQKHIRPLL
jgi:hypothetical protein